MKDYLDEQAIKRISGVLAAVVPEFCQASFISAALEAVADKELRARVDGIIGVLAQFLPADFVQAAHLLYRVPDYWASSGPDHHRRGFAAWPLIDYVGCYGLDHPDVALPLLARLTPLFSAEFAIRPFFRHHFDLTWQHCETWCRSPDPAVRRLASEGIRPRLPWGKRVARLITDPEPALALLENLRDDDSLYVRRSVANNLNDIARDHPDRVIGLCRIWQAEEAGSHRQWIIRHGTRGLVKAGYPAVFPILGYTENPALQLDIRLERQVITVGDSLDFSVCLKSTASHRQRLVVDYAIHFRKANGSLRAKVFKLRNLALAEGQSLTLNKRHAIVPITTRTYYPGKHRLEVRINGVSRGSLPFTLTG